jgi:tetratricopeptide (TPR) repeat protein
MPITRLLPLLLVALALSGCAQPDTATDADAALDEHAIAIAPYAPVQIPVPPIPDEARTAMEADLAAAETRLAENPDDVDALIWVGRRTAYLWRYHDAIDVYSEGLERWPDHPELLRHRGHRLISVREFERARADLAAAAAAVDGLPDVVEQDGQPNAAGIPTSTLQTNIHYHLGLAHYLLGDFEAAARHFGQCRDLATNDDMRVAAADWEYMALRRLGRHDEAREVIAFVTPDMELLENHVYHRRILMYKGLVSPDSLLGSADGDVALNLATQGYGVGNWYLTEGDTTRALSIFRDVVAGQHWAAFGYIAAEAELQRHLAQ